MSITQSYKLLNFGDPASSFFLVFSVFPFVCVMLRGEELDYIGCPFIYDE